MKFACLIVVYWFLDDRHCVYVKDDNAREWDDADCDSNKHTLCEIGTISAEFYGIGTVWQQPTPKCWTQCMPNTCWRQHPTAEDGACGTQAATSRLLLPWISWFVTSITWCMKLEQRACKLRVMHSSTWNGNSCIRHCHTRCMSHSHPHIQLFIQRNTYIIIINLLLKITIG